jgi:conjugative relaxase-like TrwC/TraI family protein
MLSVAKVTGNLAAGYADYLEGKTAQAELGDYYLKGGERVEAPGRWVSGAQRMGCDPDRPVGGDALRQLMAVRHPVTGEQLRRMGASGEAVAAIDATFSAPKSVSAAWAVADTELRSRIEAAHERAIDRALRYATGQVPMVRHRADRDAVVHAKAAELIATSWRHTTARAVGERVPDPQLHSHVLLHAAVRDDQRVVAIDSRSWFVHRRELGAAYRTELARELTALGFEIERGTGRGGRYFEIAGVPQELIDTWSSRHHQVQEAISQTLARTGQERLGPEAESRAALVTRRAKQPATVAELDHTWQRDARDSGFSRDELQQLRDPTRTQLEPPHVGELLRGLTEFDATFSDRQARAVALERAAGAPIEQALGALAQARDERTVVRLADGSSTTGWHRNLKRDTVTTFESLTRERLQAVPGRYVEQAAATVNRRLARRGGRLSSEQREALELACGDRQVVMIEGQAGTGKSTLLQAVALAHQADGQRVIVTSTAAVAAERLAADLAAVGVDAAAYSTTALRNAAENGQLTIDARTTVIHDEAALASTREQQHLLETVQEHWAHLIIVGDPQQSQPVGAAGLWPRLERQANRQGSHAELTTNLRALDPDDRREQARFRDGRHQESLQGYADRERLHVATDRSAAERAALEAAHRDRMDGKRTLVITQTSNEHLDALNAQAQALRARDRQLGYNTLRLPGRPYALRAGDEIQIRHTLTLPDRPIRNGTTATVTAIDPRAGQLTMRLPDDRTIAIDREQVRQADLRLAYVQHPVPAQGLTTDTIHLIVSDHATAEGTYVALTRAREQTHIHASDEPSADDERAPIERLAEHVGRSEPEVPSIALPLASEPWRRPQRQIDDAVVRELEDIRAPDPERGMGWEL